MYKSCFLLISYCNIILLKFKVHNTGFTPNNVILENYRQKYQEKYRRILGLPPFGAKKSVTDKKLVLPIPVAALRLIRVLWGPWSQSYCQSHPAGWEAPAWFSGSPSPHHCCSRTCTNYLPYLNLQINIYITEDKKTFWCQWRRSHQWRRYLGCAHLPLGTTRAPKCGWIQSR